MKLYQAPYTSQGDLTKHVTYIKFSPQPYEGALNPLLKMELMEA